MDIKKNLTAETKINKSEFHFNEPKPAVVDFNGESYPLKKTNVSITTTKKKTLLLIEKTS